MSQATPMSLNIRGVSRTLFKGCDPAALPPYRPFMPAAHQAIQFQTHADLVATLGFHVTCLRSPLHGDEVVLELDHEPTTQKTIFIQAKSYDNFKSGHQIAATHWIQRDAATMSQNIGEAFQQHNGRRYRLFIRDCDTFSSWIIHGSWLHKQLLGMLLGPIMMGILKISSLGNPNIQISATAFWCFSIGTMACTAVLLNPRGFRLITYYVRRGERAKSRVKQRYPALFS